MRLAAPLTAVLLAASAPPARAQEDPLVRGYTAAECPSCEGWNEPAAPVRLFGNTWYVGTRGLAAILVTSPAGHVLIDAGLPNSAPLILRNVVAAGFRPADVKVILNSHAHYDHAGGIAAVQRATGARVVATAWSARMLRRGRAVTGDPQLEIALPQPAVRAVSIIGGDSVVRLGPLALRAHHTGGHTPGGTTWSWRSCDAGRCLDFVYADSQTPVSADGFRFSRNDTYPDAVADFRRAHATIERLSCDVLLTPHPSASELWERVARGPDALVDATACRRYAARSRRQLEARLERER